MWRVLVLSSSLIFSSVPVAAVLLSETIGEVGEDVYTSRQSMLSGLMERLLVNAKNLAPHKDLSSEASQKEASALLLEAAVAKEADIFSVGTGLEQEIADLADKTMSHLRSRADWRRFEYSDAEVRAAAERKLAARSLIRLKSDSMRGLISETEAQKYFEENRSRFGSASFESFRDQIRSVLAQRQLEDRLKAWFEILRRKYQVRDSRHSSREGIPATP